MSAGAVSRLVCAGCGREARPWEPWTFRCASADGDDVDHVLRRELDLARLRFPQDGDERPFLRFRTLLHAYHVAVAGGLDDAAFCALVRDLDARVAAVDGRGFTTTPFSRSDELSDELGCSPSGGVWVKDETGNVAGSHKARHLFGVLVYLAVLERLERSDPGRRRELAVASCGNAALAAAVLAAAAEWPLRVFVPEDADPAVRARLDELGADVVVCGREPGVAGDPTVHRLTEALAAGAIPFTCQGQFNGLAVEGGQTLAWELAASGVGLDRLVVQVGGGALASACVHGLREALALGALPATVRVDTVQAEAAWPLKRAYDRVVARGGRSALVYAGRHRSEFMRPWEDVRHSIAHGILDDETYDWLAVVEGMLATGGAPVVVGEHALAVANALAREATGIAVDPTGSSGLAGLMELRESGRVREGERVAVLFTGVDRSRKDTRHAQLSRARHPVAQGLRTR